MPQFISKDGIWEPADLAAKADLKLRGIDHLGIKVKSKNVDNATPNPPYPVMAEPQNELPKAEKEDKFPQTKKRGSPKKTEEKK